jgi:hypothetical protein
MRRLVQQRANARNGRLAGSRSAHADVSLSYRALRSEAAASRTTRRRGQPRLVSVAGIAVVHRPVRTAADMRLDRPYLAGLRGPAKRRLHGYGQASRLPRTDAKGKMPHHSTGIRSFEATFGPASASEPPIAIAPGARPAPSCPNVNAAPSDRWSKARALACREC